MSARSLTPERAAAPQHHPPHGRIPQVQPRRDSTQEHVLSPGVHALRSQNPDLQQTQHHPQTDETHDVPHLQGTAVHAQEGCHPQGSEAKQSRGQRGLSGQNL